MTKLMNITGIVMTIEYDDEANDQADAHALLMQSQRDKNKDEDDEIQ